MGAAGDPGAAAEGAVPGAWGTRFLTDMLPMLIWLLVPVVAALGRRGRACFVTAVCVAIAIEAVGAFFYTGVTDAPIFAVASGPDRSIRLLGCGTVFVEITAPAISRSIA